MVCPEFSTSSRASSSLWSSTIAAKARSSLARSPGARSRQAGKASCAAWIAASVSASVADGTSRSVVPVDGLISVVVISHSLERAGELPVGDGGVERLQLDVGHVRVVVDDLGSERGAGDVGARPGVAGLAQGVRHVRLVGVIRVALE